MSAIDALAALASTQGHREVTSHIFFPPVSWLPCSRSFARSLDGKLVFD